MTRRLFLFLAAAFPLIAGPYPGAAETAGSDAISKDDTAFVQWASGHLNYVVGDNTSATTDYTHVVCLGDDGQITLYFPQPVKDGPGADFAVFENSFSDSFIELAFVEVSSDGVNFFRFPSASLTASLVGSFGTIDPTNLSGLAGKYRGGFGTPFDLAGLPASPLLDKSHIPFIRLVDIKGNGGAKDSDDRPIYDPHPTTGSAGFDLDAIGVIHQNSGELRMVRSGIAGNAFEIEWQSNPARNYRIETSFGLDEWTPVETLAARPDRGTTIRSLARSAQPGQFWRVVRIGE
jgi:hypothetical protein